MKSISRLQPKSVQTLLNENQKNLDAHFDRVTYLRSLLEAEEEKIRKCLSEERRLVGFLFPQLVSTEIP